jgi:MYXO-CTERM domain-containing protein
MRLFGSWCRAAIVVALLGAYACSGSISCSGCGGLPLDPIPGGFDPAARIELAAQVRLTQAGLDQLELEFPELATAYLQMQCGAPGDVPCPTRFRSLPAGTTNPSSCSAREQVCVEASTGAPGPLLGFELERAEQNGAVICRDELDDVNRRACYAWLRLETLQLEPAAPNRVRATLGAQIDTTDIPIRYDRLGLDCVVRLDSGASAPAVQDLILEAELAAWGAPGGGQLRLNVASLTANIPDMDVAITRDPVHGTGADVLLCGLANLGPVKNALIPILTRTLASRVEKELDQVLGWRCPGLEPCPTGTTCNVDGFCAEDAGGRVVPTRLGIEGRLALAGLLGELGSGGPGEGDFSFLMSRGRADARGVGFDALAGAEVVQGDAACAAPTPSPRTRPGFVAPLPLPQDGAADLDGDGSLETPYMIAAGVSQALLDQVAWIIHSTGALCTSISSFEVPLLNTGSLSLLVPSLATLTRQDKDPSAVYPVRVTLRPTTEPRLRIGSGVIDGPPDAPRLEEPLLALELDELELVIHAFVESRWVRLMTVQTDLVLALGAMVTPSNELQLVLGDVSTALTDVRIRDSEILAETPEELAEALPALLEVALPRLTGSLPQFPLPSARELGGIQLDVLGVRGVKSGATFPNLAVYANLGFDPSQAGALSRAAETEVALQRLEAEAGAPVRALLALGGRGGEERALEYQLSLDGGLWSPFFATSSLALDSPALQLEGHHTLEVRARVQGDYRSLDPTPVSLALVVDRAPPRLSAKLAPRDGGLHVAAHDTVSGDAVELWLAVGGRWRRVETDARGFVSVPEVDGAPHLGIAVAAVDEAGRRAELVLREDTARALASADEAERGGCRCATSGQGASPWWLAGAIVLFGRIARRRRAA